MADTTIAISKRFRDWLKTKGLKGESYEKIIKGMLMPEALKDLEDYSEPAIPKETNEEPHAKKEPDIIDSMFEDKLT